jgi:plastocyanin
VVLLVMTASASAATHTVEIYSSFFSPAQLTIAQGDTVTWVWMAPNHSTTRTGAGDTWDSGIQSTGYQFSRVFQSVGQFSYVCVLHAPHMSGTITVEAPAKNDSTTSLSSSSNPSGLGQEVTFTGTVSGTGGTPTGTLTFFDDLAAICSDVTLSDGSALCVTSSLDEGEHPITATYSGDSAFNGSTSTPLVQTVSPPPDVPTGFSATAASASVVSVVWSAMPNASQYQVARSSDGAVYDLFPATSATSLDDTGRSPDTSYLYQVRAIGAGGALSDFSAPDVATTVVFTDAGLAGIAVKAVHITELRTAVNAMRALAGLSAETFADHPLTAGTLIQAQHVLELRSALDAARAGLLPALSYSDPVLSIVRAIHPLELRAGTQ